MPFAPALLLRSLTGLTALGMAVVLLASGAHAAQSGTAAPTTIGSIFDGSYPELVGSGWSSCSGAVTWSLDPGSAEEVSVRRMEADLAWALTQWTRASGIPFTYLGREDLQLTSNGTQVQPTDGSPPRSRHIYLAFMRSTESASFEHATMGLGAPTSVFPQAREISGANAIFRSDAIVGPNPLSRSFRRNLYLHEIGHALGLAHDELPGSVMSATLTGATRMSEETISAIRAVTHGCPSSAAATT